MGVQGLWQLLESTGKAISPECLSGKVLAVDISMWLHKFSKGMRNSDGNPLQNSHLIGLFKSICKLLYYEIKPVFVFDGSIPVLKRQTISKRQMKRDQAISDSRQTAKRLLRRLLQRHVIGHIQGVQQEQCRPNKSKDQDIFILPSNEYLLKQHDDDNDAHGGGDNDARGGDDDDYMGKPCRRSNKTEEEFESLWERYCLDVGDVDSEKFEFLPASIKLQMLIDIQEQNKQTDYADAWMLPENSDEFSKYQINRLLELNKLTHRIETVRKQAIKDHNDSCQIASNVNVRLFYRNKKKGKKEKNSNYFCFDGGPPRRSSRTLENPLVGLLPVESSSDNFYRSDVKYRMDEKFVTVPEVAKEFEFNTRSINFNFGKKIDDDDEGRKKFGELKWESDDENEIISPSPIGNQLQTSSNSINSNNFPTNRDASKLNRVCSNWMDSNAHTKDSTNEIMSPSMKISNYSFDNVNDIDHHNDDDDDCKGDDDDCKGDVVMSVGVDLTTSIASPARDHEATLPVVVVAEEVAPVSPVDYDLREVVADGNEEEEEEEDDLLAEVLETCRNNKEQISLESIEQKLTNEVDRLKSEIGKNERLATSITEQMQQEVQNLLRLFGVPYLISPGEAEAQCAHLDKSGQTDGTITDDSDVFLFGASKVVRHLFDKDKVAELYTSEEIEKRLLLNQSDMICIAMLCGCDYTEGVKGVGPVTATEVIQEFKGCDLDCLVQFSDWWRQASEQENPPDNETKVKSKLRKLCLFEGFPNPSVFNAYKEPSVDTSKEQFTWSPPELQHLEEYALKILNWSKQQTDDMIIPLTKKLQKHSQKHMTDFLSPAPSVTSSPSLARKVRSQRVRRIVNIRKTEQRKERGEEEKTKQVSSKRQNKNSKLKSKSSKKSMKFVDELNLSEESPDDDYVDDSILASMDI